ncbi:MAG: response regulator transcription factor [Sulfurospirillaceae bacterium]|nr:response regulator transcription factor [Sulfurospirillaceae bacterium]
MIKILKDKNVLFVEDNEEFAQNFMTLLALFVKQIFHCDTITKAKQTMQTETIDMIICDIKLNDENGLDLIEVIRKDNTHLPIVVLSGNKNEEFLFRAIPLNLTAYLLKPIKYKELIDTLSKCAEHFRPSNQIILKNGYSYEPENRVLYDKEGGLIELSKKEAAFVELLMANANRIVTKDMMCESVWNFDCVSDQAIVNFVMRFRKKVGKEFIQTIAEAGYRLGC